LESHQSPLAENIEGSLDGRAVPTPMGRHLAADRASAFAGASSLFITTEHACIDILQYGGARRWPVPARSNPAARLEPAFPRDGAPRWRAGQTPLQAPPAGSVVDPGD
jgi:hypothetical protein